MYVTYVENDVPTMRDINRYVTRKHATDWQSFSLPVHLHFPTFAQNYAKLNFHNMIWKQIIQRPTLTDVTWKALEVALTNVNRQKLGLDPVDDIYGMIISLT